MSISKETKELIENYNLAYKKIIFCIYQVSSGLNNNGKLNFSSYNELFASISPAIESAQFMKKILDIIKGQNSCIKKDIERHYKVSEKITILTELNNYIWKIGSILFQMENSKFEYMGREMNLLDFYKRVEKTRILKKADAPKLDDLKERYAAIHSLINQLDDCVRFAKEIYEKNRSIITFSGQERLDLEMLFIDEDERLKTIKVGEEKLDYWDVHYDLKKIGNLAKKFQEFLENEKKKVKEDFLKEKPHIEALEKELDWIEKNSKLLGMLLSNFYDDLPKLVKAFERIELLKKGEIDHSEKNVRLMSKSDEIISDIESAFKVLQQSSSFKHNFNNLRILLDSRTELFVEESKMILGK